MSQSPIDWNFSSVQFRLKKREAEKVFRNQEVKEYALSALHEIEKISREITEKQNLYLSGHSNYKQSILKDIKFIQNNLINAVNFPKVFDTIDLEALSAFFSPIEAICKNIRKTFEEEKKFSEDEMLSKQFLREEQKRLDGLVVFETFLKKIRSEVASKNPQPSGVYFAYAWPCEKNSKKECWVQDFLIVLKKHFTFSGIHGIHLDIESCRCGESIYKYMEQVRHDDYAVVFGTESLKEKLDQGLSCVCVEGNHILRKREDDQQKGLFRVFPILLSGEVQTAFPVEFERHIAIRDWREKDYLHCFQELYLNLFDLDPADYLGKIREIWDECSKGNDETQLATKTDQKPQSKVKPLPLPEAPSSSRKSVLKWNLCVLLVMALSLVAFIKKENFYKRESFKTPNLVKSIHPYFIRRSQYLDELVKLCITERKQSIAKVVLCGEAGIGKSEIAIGFANEYLDEFAIVHWISSETEDSINEGYRGLAKQIGVLFEEGEAPETIRSRIFKHLEEETFSHPWLLIYDGLMQPLELPQRGRGAVIVTSRTHLPWRDFDCIEVQSFTQKEALRLFERLLGTGKLETRLAMIEELDHFPLALDQAACYIFETPSMTEEIFLDLVRQKKVALIEHISSSSHYRESMIASWAATHQHLNEVYPEAIEWFHFASHLYPEQIPLHWIKKWLKEFKGEINNVRLELRANDILRVLVGYSLIRFDEQNQTFSLKRLIQEFELERQEKWENTRMEVLRFLLQGVECLTDIREVESRMDLWEELRHWEISAANFLSLYTDVMECREIPALMNALGNWKCVSGDYPLSKKLHKAALQYRKRVLGDQHLETAISLDNLGWILDDLGEYEKSKQCYEEALIIRKKLLGQEHLLVADSMGKLGWALCRLNHYKEACDLHKKSLKIRKKFLGDSHVLVAVSMKNLALALGKQARYAEAREFHEQALLIRKNYFGKTHPHVAHSLFYLGELLVEQGQYQEAAQMFDQTLMIFKSCFMSLHPYMTRAMSSKVDLLIRQGSYEEAKALSKEVLETRKNLLGDNHLDLTFSLNNLADVYFEKGKYIKAQKLYQESLRIRKNLLKEKDLQIAESMQNLGRVAKALGQYSGAKAYFEKALTIKNQYYKGNHPDISRTLFCLGEVLEELGEYEQAKELHMRALQVRKHFFGEKHPEVAESLYHLGRFLKKIGRYADSVQSYSEALKMLKEFLGEEHPCIGEITRDLATVFMRLGRFKESKKLHKDNLEMQMKILGKEHPNVAASMNDLALVLRMQGQFHESQFYYEKALKMRKKFLGKQHPDVALSMSYLANLFEAQGKYSKSLELYEEAYTIGKKLLGKDHPRVINIENYFAKALGSSGNYHRACDLLEHAIEIGQMLRVNHSDTADMMSTLAWLKHTLGKYEESEKLYLQAIDILKNSCDESHYLLIYSYFYLSWVLEDQGKLGEAERILNQLIERVQESLRDHPYLGYLYHRLGCVCAKQGKVYQGKKLIYQAVKACKKEFGQDHPHVIDAYDALGWIYGKEGNYEKARKVLLMTFEKGNKLFGEEHPRQAMTLQHLGEVVEMQGKSQEAALAYQKAYQIRKKFLGEEHPHTTESRESLQRIKT